ncbi:MAG: DUF2334 domain-containing protein [Nanobdellota archaeon]
MNHTIKIKIYFTMLIVFFVLTLVGGQYYYNQYGFSTNGFMYEFVKNPPADMYEDYYVSAPHNQIILRLDDAGAWHYDDIVPKIAEDVTSRNMSLVIGVIPEKISQDTAFLTYMRELVKNPNIEVAMHGYSHTEEEFRYATLGEARDWIQAGKEEIIKQLKVVPITFIPPYNVYSKETLTVLQEEGFKVISGDNKEYSINGDILMLGYTSKTFDFSKNKNIPTKQIIAECNQSIEERGYCEIMIHPQDFLTSPDLEGPRKLDSAKYAEFLKLLDKLQELEAESITFKDNLVLKE